MNRALTLEIISLDERLAEHELVTQVEVPERDRATGKEATLRQAQLQPRGLQEQAGDRFPVAAEQIGGCCHHERIGEDRRRKG
jgi:hypothetical protein